ncbi:FKBP-type peptidyl-prolyl cis-trans isomerase [Marivirga sp. S37H4]|uniref:Peptidyl-prolyl cis-trans isomerase n=1 Tax=Marivirga aurantiaca TaxID=2802615 RepID=A0A934WZI3_9BACT|nr:FKBP-type peptidyl-prolyl cis-trans isomerase [Marivirga aurantiaca]MBK6265879.1 FKBP-type peptidyl-prolyl cis-trans isomerase [Marivirga aurantiaca]
MFRNLILILCAGAIFSSCNKDCENEYGQCSEEQLAKDIQIIQNYLEDNNLEAERHFSDLFYIIDHEGDGDLPNRGQELSVNYVGKYLDGRVFDTSVDSVAREAGIFSETRVYEPIKFQLGAGQVILGWEIGLALLKEGSVATFIIPSGLAYGPEGKGPIPPNTVLLFEVELVDIKF